MNILPILFRELRAEARHPINYTLRMIGAAIFTLLLGTFLWDDDVKQSGDTVFRALSLIVFCGIWIAVPPLTADCLSREKREGTLGLLFLTPLKPIEIILGKGMIHAVRSLTLILAVIPILTVPFVLGGITAANVLSSLVLDASALL
ncbi:MAG: ABC transporter permease, partial [Verrucomicrobiota bacterium]